MTDATPRVSSAWLALRETADAAARAPEFVDLVRKRLAENAPLVIHDLGSGTGSMGRWLAPRLPGPQHWILHDRDADLLTIAARNLAGTAADGAPVTVETRLGDISRLTAADLGGAALVTASALLDLLTAEEVDRVAAACAGAGCPALLTLSVNGRVELTPGDPLDAEVAEAFNADQRRTVGGRRLLGPDAVDAAVAAFGRLGAEVLTRPSPWRLRSAPTADRAPAPSAPAPSAPAPSAPAPRGADADGRADGGVAAGQAELILEWFTGWVDVACERRPELAEAVADYANRRTAEVAAGRLGVVVGHVDLFVG